MTKSETEWSTYINKHYYTLRKHLNTWAFNENLGGVDDDVYNSTLLAITNAVHNGKKLRGPDDPRKFGYLFLAYRNEFFRERRKAQKRNAIFNGNYDTALIECTQSDTSEEDFEARQSDEQTLDDKCTILHSKRLLQAITDVLGEEHLQAYHQEPEDLIRYQR